MDNLTSNLQIAHTDDDTLFTSLIKVARMWAEKYTGRAFITQTRKAYYVDHSNIINLPYAPIQSVTSVTRKRYDQSTALTVDSDYYVQGNDRKFLRMATLGTTQPGVSVKDFAFPYDLEVVYVCGYGDAASDVPQDIIEAVSKIAATLYLVQDETGLNAGNVDAMIPFSAKMLLDPYMVL